MMKISLLNFMITCNDSSTVEICGNSFSGYNAYSRSLYHSKGVVGCGRGVVYLTGASN